MNIANKVKKGSDYMDDFEMAYALSVDAHTPSHDQVKFYFEDGSSLDFYRKDGIWLEGKIYPSYE